MHDRNWWRRSGQGTQTVLLCLLLSVATVAAYYAVHTHPFSEFDDFIYVTRNVHVQSGVSWETVTWAFTTFHGFNWHPLTWLSHALDYQLYELRPAGHHDTNVLLHVLNAVLLFLVLKRATGFPLRSFMVAALFALHPINVESVAWVAERKTLLSTTFFLLALGAYRWYASVPQNEAHAGKPGTLWTRVVRYLVVALLFACGLMAKPQVIMLPFVLLLWDYWPLQRMSFTGKDPGPGTASEGALPAKSLSCLLQEKIPLLCLALGDAFVTIKAQGVGGPRFWHYPLSVRLDNAIVSYAQYLGKTFWPFGLAPEYPHPGNSLQAWQVYGALTLLFAISVLAVAGRRHRYLLVGWLWFLVVMLPMIGIIQVGRQAMADRYAYQPFIGLFIMICWSTAELAGHKHLSAVWLPSVSGVVLLALMVLTYRQVGYWKDDQTLWAHALNTIPNHWVAEDKEGLELLRQGREDEAMQFFHQAASVYPYDFVSNLNLAIYQQQHSNLREAIVRYKRALPEAPDIESATKIYTNMATAYRGLGDIAMADQCLERVARLRATAGHRSAWD
jgi:tetratricopeptide (TPR) repeat protein